MAADLILLCALAFAGDGARPGIDDRKSLKAKDDLIASLYELQRRVRAGDLPTEEELALGRVSRERILAGIDVVKARRLGIEPQAVRSLLVPGFGAEIDQLSKRLQAHDLTPPETVSPLLTFVLEVEQQLFTAADRRRQRAGIKSPIDSTALAQRLEAPAPPLDDKPAATSAPDPVAPSPAVLAAATRNADPRLVGKALYRSGRYGDALKAWERVRFDDPALALELIYMHADALFRTGKADAALTEWERLAADHADSSFGQQAAFALNYARAMVALQASRADQGAGRPGTRKEPAAPRKEAGNGTAPSKDGGRREP